MPEGPSESPVWTPLTHSHGQWTGKIEGKISNLAHRNTVTMKVPACVTLPDENAKPDKYQTGPVSADIQARVWFGFHVNRGKISRGMCSHVQSDDGSCEVGVELWQWHCQRCGVRDLWAHLSPPAPFLWAGGYPALYISSPPPSIIWFCYFRFIIISSVSLICLHRPA